MSKIPKICAMTCNMNSSFGFVVYKKNSGEILDKIKGRDFNATSLSTYNFSTVYTTLPHD